MIIPPLFTPLLPNIGRAISEAGAPPLFMLLIVCVIIFLVQNIIHTVRTNWVVENFCILDILLIICGIFSVLFVNPLYLMLVWMFMPNPAE